MRVLVGDDQADVLQAAQLLLKVDGHDSVAAGTPQAVLDQARSQPFDVLLLDMNYARDTTSGGEGLSLVRALRASGVETPVVLMTAWGSIDLAVEAMRLGATDFVQKPWDNTRLLETIRSQGAKARQAGADMKIARQVQQNLLGRPDIPMRNLDYAGRCLPAGAVGGDYYDFLSIDEETFGVALGDVAGKGVSAAILMAHLQAGVRSRHDLARRPLALVQAASRLFWQASLSSHYTTLFYGVFDAADRTFTYASAGHPPGILLRPGKLPEVLDSTGAPAGMFGEWHGQQRTISLAPGDRLALVTDGVLEAGINGHREFGSEGLLRCLARWESQNASTVVDCILAEAGACGFEDDMTAIVLRVS